MRKFIENLVSFFIIIISLGTVYFCLDVFEIIDVPEKYSIVSLFSTQIEILAEGSSISDVPEKIESIKKNIVVEEKNNKTNGEKISIDDIEGRLAALQNKKEEEKHVSSSQANDTQKFYYNQLDEYGKIIYNKMDEHLDDLKTGTYTIDYGTEFNNLLQDEANTEILNNSFQLAINAITFDNPDLFYIDVTKMYLLTEITTRAFSTTYKVSIGGNGKSYLTDEFLGEGSVNVAIDDVNKVKGKVVEMALRENSDVDKMKVVHDYLVDNNEYDAMAGSMVYNVYGTLINQKSVCEGYARSFKCILDELNIPCIIACGIGRNSEGATESHAWNYVKIDEVWYAVDVTWDDPVIRGEGVLSEQEKHTFFLKGSDKFFENHFEDGNIVGGANFKYPEISKEDFVF